MPSEARVISGFTPGDVFPEVAVQFFFLSTEPWDRTMVTSEFHILRCDVCAILKTYISKDLSLSTPVFYRLIINTCYLPSPPRHHHPFPA